MIVTTRQAIQRIAVIVVGMISPMFLTSPVRAQPCSIGDSSEIDKDSHKILHDFDTLVPGCSPEFGPSGIVYHPHLDRLIVISDKGGQFATMKTDGSEVHCRDIVTTNGHALKHTDHEGVTFADPTDGSIFVGVESGSEVGVAIIRQVELSSARVISNWKIGFPGGIERNNGLESITFVPDDSHEEGGTFYIGDQTAKTVIGRCEVPIKSRGNTNALYGCSVEITPNFKEISGLDYVASAKIRNHRGVVFISSDSDNKIMAYSTNGKPLDWSADFPSTSNPGQEGHAINGCDLYISSDANDNSRKIHRYRFSP